MKHNTNEIVSQKTLKSGIILCLDKNGNVIGSGVPIPRSIQNNHTQTSGDGMRDDYSITDAHIQWTMDDVPDVQVEEDKAIRKMNCKSCASGSPFGHTCL